MPFLIMATFIVVRAVIRHDREQERIKAEYEERMQRSRENVEFVYEVDQEEINRMAVEALFRDMPRSSSRNSIKARSETDSIDNHEVAFDYYKTEL